MSVFNQLLTNIGENIGDYAKGAWNLFLQQASMEISGLADYYLLGDKKVTLLNSNLEYITNKNSTGSIDTVFGNNQHENDNGRKTFNYYTGKAGESIQTTLSQKPLLAKPNEDKRKDIQDNFQLPNMPSTYVKGTSINDDHYVEYEAGASTEISPDGEFGESTDDTVITNSNNNLLSQTNRWFRRECENEELKYIENRFRTQISRFHSNIEDVKDLKSDIGNSAFSNDYGLSHGRNLRKLEPTEENGFDDPYCRVWTWHHQYRKVDDLIRPLKGKSGNPITQEELSNDYNWSAFRSLDGIDGKDGGSRLAKYGSMYKSDKSFDGFVNITPSRNENGAMDVDVKHCMFSIENLAWKGAYCIGDELNGLSEEQIGPLGGRIMWFPPYDLKFSEQTDARWEENVFIGRGEPMWTYSNTNRSGSLSFKMLIDHPAVLDYWERRNETPSSDSGVDDIESKEQEMLRFFAGCSILKATEPAIETTLIEPTPEPVPEPVVQTTDKILQFFVFFPNNYSGKDDEIGGEVDPIEYLLNGVDTQQYYPTNDARKEAKQSIIPLSTNIFWGQNTTRYGGYEMREVGISTQTSTKNTNDINYVYAYDSEDKIGTPQGTRYLAAKLLGSEAVTDSSSAKYPQKRYLYRADKNTLNQVLLGGDDSYIDKKSYKLNSTGYKNAVSYFKLKDVDSTYSLTELYVALKGDNSHVFNGLYNSEHVNVLKSIFDGSKGKITQVICKGMASSQSNSKRSDSNQTSLAKQRAETVQKWLKKNLSGDEIVFSQSTFSVSAAKTSNPKDANDKTAKLTRMAFVEIHYTSEQEIDTSETDDSTYGVVSTQDIVEEEIVQENAIEIIQSPVTGRYDNESLFFNRLTKEDPFMTRLLSERIKNFNPAFHSMTPEGFNARLTFLQQCTRQGPTLSHSDTDSNNAANLAFGRPPICVLRVGDFYNTKIVITNITMNYDPLQWDLNQEGIGVMPMIADITISFNFIGGSELGGPIQRLQNALSFNYYANASVYDNRSEQIEYGDNGDVTNFKPYISNYNL